MHFSDNYDSLFEALTGHGPFPWQQKLYNEFLSNSFRESCPIPSGLGKTSIIAIWLLALSHHARNGTVLDFPRRLVYVVNRRTVVDQSTDEAEKMREALIKPELREIASALQSLRIRAGGSPFAISTLRGQFADNAEWRDDPARPAVIIGTVDMIGSRLLFSGYGCGFRSRPLHAGFLGQDVLLVHDEAHLEPAFQKLVTAVEMEQRRSNEFGKFRVMELTATSRSEANGEGPLFTEEDRNHPEVRKRIKAEKGVVCHPVEGNKIADKVTQLAKKHKDSGQAILIFLRRVEDVKKVAASLCKTVSVNQVETLTGTLRGWERDKLARDNAVFARFMRNSNTEPQPGTVYLVCTSAGEVGVNISADHLVCDLTPFDSMMQRFGRVNRFGDGDACIDIVHRKFGKETEAATIGALASDDVQLVTDSDSRPESPPAGETGKKEKPLTPFDRACAQTLLLLRRLPKRGDQCHDGSPSALAGIPAADRQAAFTPEPVILLATDILFDAWALTTVRQKLPGRPPVADWLHGISSEWEPPATYVAWREEVDLIAGDLLKHYPPGDLLEDYPLKPHELLREQTKRVFEELEQIAGRSPELPVWLIDPAGEVKEHSLSELIKKDRQKNPVMNLADCIVLLSPAAGGLRKDGMLDGNTAVGDLRYDIADELADENGLPRRCRIWNDQEPPKGMRPVRTIDVKIAEIDGASEDEVGTPGRRYWRWYVRPRAADDDGSRTARVEQVLSDHLQLAKNYAGRLVAKLGLGETEALAVEMAARLHDCGKDRLIWQRSIGNHNYPGRVLAKSGRGMRPLDLTGYRHEFGSLIDVSNLEEFRALSPAVQDLVLHLIAAHHGRARPHFPESGAFDHKWPETTSAGISREVPRRFALLQRKYGRWGLAYLESLVRAADIMASQAAGGTEFDEPSSMPVQGGGQ